MDDHMPLYMVCTGSWKSFHYYLTHATLLRLDKGEDVLISILLLPSRAWVDNSGMCACWCRRSLVLLASWLVAAYT